MFRIKSTYDLINSKFVARWGLLQYLGHCLRGVFASSILLHPALAQIEPVELEMRPLPLPADEMRPERRMSELSLVDVSEPDATFSAAPDGTKATLRFSTTVRNTGIADRDYLVKARAADASKSFWSKVHRVAAGDTVQIEEHFSTDFTCRGYNRFSITVALIDDWEFLNAVGIPVLARQIGRVMRWVDVPVSRLGKSADSVDCSDDPFAAGLVVEADLNRALMTPFVPHIHGFNFDNSFNSNMVPALDIRTGGLCGGMVYAALDYYYREMEIPQQDYRPADHTQLFQYIYNRQAHSLYSNADQWTELTVNPLGARNSEMFSWGLGERLVDVREYVDRGEPVVLGLKGANGTGDHQVIAVGYDLGRYRGDLGDHREDLKILTYDPNFPNVLMTLVPDLVKEVFTYEEDRDRNYQTYFVDKNYSGITPPPVPSLDYGDDSLIHELIVEVHTGNDDLRGGGHADITIVYRDGSEHPARDINGGRRWLENYSQFIQIGLEEPTAVENLKELRLNFTSGGTGTHDNWNIGGIWVSARGNFRQVVYDAFASPLARLTGTRSEFVAYLNTGTAPDNYVRQLNLTFTTGGDDLRGGNDNLDVHVLFSDGTEQIADVVNGFLPWRNNTTSVYPIVLESPRRRSDIRGVRLVKSPGGDDWNLEALAVSAVPRVGDAYIVFSDRNTPLKHFTESARSEEYLFR